MYERAQQERVTHTQNQKKKVSVYFLLQTPAEKWRNIKCYVTTHCNDLTTVISSSSGCTYFWKMNIPMTTAKEMRSTDTHIRQYSSGLWKHTHSRGTVDLGSASTCLQQNPPLGGAICHQYNLSCEQQHQNRLVQYFCN